MWRLTSNDGRRGAIKSPVTGVAMGLILEEYGSYAVLTDILGDEDHLEIWTSSSGTENGITSSDGHQSCGITPEIKKQALSQAKDGYVYFKKCPKQFLKQGKTTPRIETMKVATDKIREVIGSGGKVIREIVETSGAKVDISDDGTIKIASPDGASIQSI